MSLHRRAVDALRACGADVKDDADLETLTLVLAERDVTGVVMTSCDTVTFWSVWPEVLPAERLDVAAELVTRANTELYSSALELSMDSGTVSVRCGLRCAELADVPDELLGRLLLDAATEAGRVAASHHSALAAVAEGVSAKEALGLRL